MFGFSPDDMTGYSLATLLAVLQTTTLPPTTVVYVAQDESSNFMIMRWIVDPRWAHLFKKYEA